MSQIHNQFIFSVLCFFYRFLAKQYGHFNLIHLLFQFPEWFRQFNGMTVLLIYCLCGSNHFIQIIPRFSPIMAKNSRQTNTEIKEIYDIQPPVYPFHNWIFKAGKNDLIQHQYNNASDYICRQNNQKTKFQFLSDWKTLFFQRNHLRQFTIKRIAKRPIATIVATAARIVMMKSNLFLL